MIFMVSGPVSSKSRPFYTGGRVDKFKKRYGK